MKKTAIVWLTGVITQYSILDNYNIEELTVNHNLLNKLIDKYNVVALVCFKDDMERAQYNKLFISLGIADKIRFMFIPYNTLHTELISRLISHLPNVTTYIDCEKKRLFSAACAGINNKNCIHISQLLD